MVQNYFRKTIKQNFDLDIQYYMIVDFKGFEQSVDILAPEGIEMDVEKAMSENIGVSLEPGVQNLNGKNYSAMPDSVMMKMVTSEGLKDSKK